MHAVEKKLAYMNFQSLYIYTRDAAFVLELNLTLGAAYTGVVSILSLHVYTYIICGVATVIIIYI